MYPISLPQALSSISHSVRQSSLKQIQPRSSKGPPHTKTLVQHPPFKQSQRHDNEDDEDVERHDRHSSIPNVSLAQSTPRNVSKGDIINKNKREEEAKKKKKKEAKKNDERASTQQLIQDPIIKPSAGRSQINASSEPQTAALTSSNSQPPVTYLAAVPTNVIPALPTDIKEVEDEKEEQGESDEDTDLFNAPNLTKYITKNEEFPVTGSGFGQIWKCTNSADQGPSQVAVKLLLTHQQDGTEKKTRRIRRELGICARLKHPNIISMCGYTYGFGPLLAIVIPWAENGNLTAYLKRHKEDAILTSLRRLEILRDIGAGLEYLHTNGVVHGNLTGPNVLIDGNGIACLTDFGLSLIYSEEISISLASRSSQCYGDIRWLDPELLGYADDTSPVKRAMHNDMYSFGGVMLQVLTGKIPFHYLGDMGVLQSVRKGVKPSRACYPPVSDNHWGFITECWSDVETRPTANEVVEWINNEFNLLSSSSSTVP